MTRGTWRGVALVACLIVALIGLSAHASAQAAGPLRVLSEQTAKGFVHPESVGCDTRERMLYVSQFGSEPLDPTRKDGKGKISKVSTSGQVLEDQVFPGPGDVLNKPKGIWIAGDRLWVTDIDAIWVFDLGSRRGRKVELPGSGTKFANDPTVIGQALYVSDNRADRLYRVEPADFLDAREPPKVTVVFTGKSINPNGLYPGRDGSLLMVGFMSAQQPRGIYSMSAGGEITTVAKDLGSLDGLYQMDDGTILATDWNSGSLFAWSAKDGKQTLASGFKGPADFCVLPEAGGLLVVVPDLVTSELRFVRLAR